MNVVIRRGGGDKGRERGRREGRGERRKREERGKREEGKSIAGSRLIVLEIVISSGDALRP